MDDLDVLARDFGYKPSGKSAPMRSDGEDRRTARPSSSPFVVNDHGHNRNGDDPLFKDVFWSPPKYSSSSNNMTSSMQDFDYDSIFKSSAANEPKNKSTSSLPVYDKPVYDEDIFDRLKGKQTSVSATFDDDAFPSKAHPPPKHSDQYDELLGNLGRVSKPEEKNNNRKSTNFDDLLPGFGSVRSTSDRQIPEPSLPQKSSRISNQTTSSVMDDLFGVFESTAEAGTSTPGSLGDPLEEFSKPGNVKMDASSVGGGVFDDLDPLSTFGKSGPVFSSNISNKRMDESPSRARSTAQTYASDESSGKSSYIYAESPSQKKAPVNNFEELHQTVFDMPNISKDSYKSFGQNVSSPSDVDSNFNETYSQVDMSPRSLEHLQKSDDAWLTVSEIPLFTQPTSAPPPTRPPPPIPRRGLKTEAGSFTLNTKKKSNEFYSSSSNVLHSQSPNYVHPLAKSYVVSPIDELEDVAEGRDKSNGDENADEEVDMNSAAAAMKEAMDRAEAKFKYAKEAREREYARTARTREVMQQERDDQVMQDSQVRELKENQERLDSERQQREREEEEEEKEQRRLEMERERESEKARERERERERAREIEREKARQAVERATREARERAMAEACEKAATGARMKAEKAAVEKVTTEARQRAERAAVQRAQAEARERAAAEARERAERAAAEARKKANAEAREKEAREKAVAANAEMEARRRTERAAAERATAEVRERAAASAKLNQQNNDNDLESFFSMGSRSSSAPRPRANSSDPAFDQQFQSRGGPEGPRRTTPSGAASSNIRKASSTINIVDDLTSIFGAPPQSGEFQENNGESEERRRARLERHQRTQERASKAVAEKNQRDLQAQREQEERYRISEALDIEIKRWAAGKEGNLRAMLSTLQYLLWPECGWQPVSLTDLINGASVKKAYRKATLCIHPDKVQQKGANLQQKYIAEKVFDLLKEAWNKFNSEELF